MRKSIWKFGLKIEDVQIIQLPKGAEILSCQVQKSKLCMWAIVNVDAELIPREFHQFGTGSPLPDSMKGMIFIDTFQLFSGEFVGHLFEKV